MTHHAFKFQYVWYRNKVVIWLYTRWRELLHISFWSFQPYLETVYFEIITFLMTLVSAVQTRYICKWMSVVVYSEMSFHNAVLVIWEKSLSQKQEEGKLKLHVSAKFGETGWFWRVLQGEATCKWFQLQRENNPWHNFNVTSYLETVLIDNGNVISRFTVSCLHLKFPIYTGRCYI